MLSRYSATQVGLAALRTVKGNVGWVCRPTAAGATAQATRQGPWLESEAALTGGSVGIRPVGSTSPSICSSSSGICCGVITAAIPVSLGYVRVITASVCRV